MNFHFVWKSFDIATGATTGMFEQTIYGDDLTNAVSNFTTLHGELSADENGEALEIVGITEVPE